MAHLSRQGLLGVVGALPVVKWLEDSRAYRVRVGPVTLADGAVRAAAEQVASAISTGDAESASKWIGTALVISDGALIRERRFVEELRPSIHWNSPSRLAVLHHALGSAAATTDGIVSESVTARLNDFRSFVSLYRDTRAEELALVEGFHRNPSRALYTMLARVELAFAGLTRHVALPFPAAFEEMGREDLATAASYAIEAYNQAHRLDKVLFTADPVEEKDLAAFDAELVRANRLAELIDLEADVFRHEYSCRQRGHNAYEISPPTERLGMARALGYIRQAARARDRVREPVEGRRFAPLVQEFVDKLGPTMLPVRGTRIVIELPLPAIEMMAAVFADEGLYVEEAQQLRRAATELLASPGEILACEVAPGFRIHDALKMQRVFRLLGGARLLRAQQEGIPVGVSHNSLVGAMRFDQIEDLLVAGGFRRDAVTRYLEVMCWKAASPEHLDLQYTPFLRIGTIAAIPAMVCAFSNVVRNILITSRVRLHASAEDNPVERIVSTALVEAGAAVKMNRKYEHGGRSGEVDVLARVGGCVFALECKETLEPCSSFELRTTWDYLDKARAQLNRFRTAWGDREFRERLCRDLGWPEVGEQVTTGIVLSHRILAGASVGGHPVRPAWEFANFCATGMARMEMLGRSFEVPMRGVGALKPAELSDYLSDDGAVYGPFWKAFREESVEWQLGATTLRLHRYGFSPLRHFAESGVASPAERERLIAADEAVQVAQARAMATMDEGAMRSAKARYLLAAREGRRILSDRFVGRAKSRESQT